MEILFCRNCRRQLREEDRYCPYCGEEVRGYGEKITVIVPSGVTKIEVRYEENETAQEEAKGAKDIRLDGVIIPEPCYLAALKYRFRLYSAGFPSGIRKRGKSSNGWKTTVLSALFRAASRGRCT